MIFTIILFAYLLIVLFAWALCVNAAPRRSDASRPQASRAPQSTVRVSARMPEKLER
jgi:hypothetical protein